jgi:hypothetical protein
LSWADNNTDNTNVLFLVGPGALLASYTKNAGIYRCPADLNTCKEFGVPMLRVRSIAMNAFIQGGCNGPSTVSALNSAWRCYNKQADIQKPAPSDLIIHLDEQGDDVLPLRVRRTGVRDWRSSPARAPSGTLDRLGRSGDASQWDTRGGGLD